MLVSQTNMILNSFLLFSPLDQFGDDTDLFIAPLDNLLTDFVPGSGYIDDLIDFSGLTEIESFGD
jgi:hypothetical protein